MPPSCELLDSRRRALAKKLAPPLRGACGTYGRVSSVGVVGVAGMPGEGNGVPVLEGVGDASGPPCCWGSPGLGSGVEVGGGGVADSLELSEDIQDEAALRRGVDRVVSIGTAWFEIFSRLLRWSSPGRLGGTGVAGEPWPLLFGGTAGAEPA